jgi:integrase
MNTHKDRDHSEPSPQNKRGACVLTAEQIKHLLSTARGHRLEAFMTVAMTTGLRSGELLALRWRDLDVAQQCLHVCCAVSYNLVRELHAPGGERMIALPDVTQRAFDLQRRQQEEARRFAGSNWQDLDLVFPDPLGCYASPNALRQHYKALFAAAGLPHLRFHDLRCTTTAYLVQMGANAHVVQSILGFHWLRTSLALLVPPSLALQREAMRIWDALLLEEWENR